MKLMKRLTATMLMAALGANPAFAQDDGDDDGNDGGDDLDVTITVIPEDADLPDAVTAELTLPMDEEGNYIPSEEGVENSAEGLATANEARADGRAFGEAAAEAAQENRENLGSGSRPDLEDLIPGSPPGIPDDIPGPPELPERPEVPEPGQ